MSRSYTKFTLRQLEFIEENIEGTPYKVLTEMFNKEFNTERNVEQVKKFANRNGLKNNINTRFKKNVSPSNTNKVGDIVTIKKGKHKGVKKIKVKNDGAYNERWVWLSRYVWQQHYGEIPDGFMVIQVDGNVDNHDIDNLMLVDRSDHIVMASKGLMYTGDKELFTAGLNIAKIIKETRRIERADNHD